jgi:hypothetical protein
MPKKEDLSKVNREVESIVGQIRKPHGVTVKIRGSVRDMDNSFPVSESVSFLQWCWST